MVTATKGKITVERLLSLYDQQRELLRAGDTPVMAANREQAIRSFKKLGFPDSKVESWCHADLTESLQREYDMPFRKLEEEDPLKVFRCNIPHLDTAIIGQLNGWYVSKDVPLMELGNGIIMGSLAEAKWKYPALIEKYYGSIADITNDAFAALNTAFAQDGVFIYVPDNVRSPRPVQLINVIHHTENLFLQSRNLVIVGKNAYLSMVHCDDSYNHQPSFSNILTEIYVGEQSTLDHYKLQNLNNESAFVSNTCFKLEANTSLESNSISLNGGVIRNNIRVLFNAPHGTANINGIYLMDRKQHIDNNVFIDHAAPYCTSNELFKGVLDEHARGVFNGHVLVRKNAVKTDARQSNRNILLTDTARVNSKPFLEIYNDDVKCSHGATTGQLDAEALFYLRQRGISEENARMLLMFAFADEVVGKIAIPQLRQRIEDMIKRRLQGELQICEQCVLHCSTPDHPVEFQIDLGKLRVKSYEL